jgi:hypothetical protein
MTWRAKEFLSEMVSAKVEQLSVVDIIIEQIICLLGTSIEFPMKMARKW